VHQKEHFFPGEMRLVKRLEQVKQTEGEKEMKTSKVLLLVVVLAVLSTLVGCAQPAAPTQAPAPAATVAPAKPAPATTSSGYVVPVQKCAPNCTYKDMVVGFIQTGPEGAWRTANNASFDEYAKQQGITLKVYDAQGKVENQISAFHTFNQDPTVNVIIIAADDTKGFDDVLKEAATAGKLVMLEDRSIDSSSTLYYTRIGSDFVAEGQKSAVAMCDLLKNFTKKNVVEVSGAVGASAGIDRAKGFRQKMGDCGINITASQTGNWAVADSKAVVEAWLKDPTLKDFQGVFAHNDEEALGAIQAIKEAGLQPGKDVMVLGLDATKDGFAALIDGTLGADIECNPLLGPQVLDAALKGLNGDATMPSFVPSNEGQFFASQGADALKAILPSRKY
jgi:ABC-type sugar transport system substrate-binding protein